MFSIVMPIFNARHTVGRTVETVLAQSFATFELIVVDDGSTDGGAEMLGELGDPRIRILRQANAGAGMARNRGIHAARNDWIAFLDGDDLWLPEHVAELDRVRARFPEAGLIGCAYLDTDSEGRFALPAQGEGEVRRIDYFDRIGRGEKAMWISSSAVHRRAHAKVGGFRPFAYGDDSEYLARVALDFPVAASTRVTAIYVHGTGGITDRSARRWQGAALSRVDDIAPAAAAVAERCRRLPPAERPPGADRFLDAYVGYCLESSLAIGDVPTLRRLRRLYRRRAPMRARLVLAVSRLPMPAARPLYRLGWAAMRLLRPLRRSDSPQ